MTSRDIELLSREERSLARASHNYYLALLAGTREEERKRLRQAWLNEICRCWPGALKS